VTIRVLLVDDQAVVRYGLRLVLESEPDIDIVGEAADGHAAVAAATRLRPDVVVMDIRMPQLDGIAAVQQISEAGLATRALILTTFDLDEYVFQALRVGASGFLLKDAPPEDLVAAIRLIAAGEALLAPTVTRRVIEAFVRQPPATQAAPTDLTTRELEVLRLMARGRSNDEIAADLFLSRTTVKTHVTRVLAKLGVRDRVQAVVHAYETGLVHPAPPSTRSDPGRRI
jgi:DNA-binding NarL/FixJ family response regulator